MFIPGLDFILSAHNLNIGLITFQLHQNVKYMCGYTIDYMSGLI